jgi:hypothetical protein
VGPYVDSMWFHIFNSEFVNFLYVNKQETGKSWAREGCLTPLFLRIYILKKLMTFGT